MKIRKSIQVLGAGTGFFASVALLAKMVGEPAAMLATAAGSFAVHSASHISAWYAEEFEKNHHDPGELAEIHELRKLVVMAIEDVLDGVVQSENWAGDKDGKDRLENYKKNVDYLVDAAINPRFEPLWDQNITDYFMTEVKDFTGKKALSQEAWIYFLEPNYDPRVAALHAVVKDAATALHEHFLETLVGVYRDAFTNHPKVYVAVTTEILKKIWNSVSRIEAGVARLEEKADSNTQALREEIRALATGMANAHPAAMQACIKKFEGTLGAFRSVVDEIVPLLRELHEGVAEVRTDVKAVLKIVSANQANAGIRGITALTDEEINQKIAPYLQSLITAHQKIELRGIRDGSDPVIRLELKDAYVPLQGKKKLQVDESDAERGGGGRRLHLVKGGREPVKEDADVPMKKVLGEGHRLAITGGAGSGKTTVLRYIAWWLAASRLGEPAAEEEFRLGLPADVPLPIPIFVSLAAFAPYRHAPPSYTSNFESFLADDLKRRDAKFDLPKEFFELLLREGRNVILLLDGLDEVADDTQRASMRQWAGSFAADRPELRVVLTCRTIAWRKDSALLNFRDIAVQPLDMKTHIEPMVAKAYACIEPHNETERNKGIKQLVDGIKGLELKRLASLGVDDRPLVDSPLMVRMMLIVQRSNVKLPDERADLFDKAVDAIYQVDHGIDEDTKPDFTQHWETYLEMAQRLAYHMHCEGVDKGRLIEKEGGVDKVFAAPSEYHPFIKRFLDYAQKRGGVLEEYGGPYRFVHHAFQEFLVARYLRTVEAVPNLQKIINVVTPLLADPWWREPILLTAGYKARESRSTVIYFIEQLAAAGKSADEQFSGAELAGIAALEWGDCPAVLRVKCANRILELLNNKDALEHSQPVIRARAGDVLSRLGDPRFDPARFYLPVDAVDDLLGFKEIEEDKDFKIGIRSGEAASQRIYQATGYEPRECEINDDLTPTRRFYIARHPVTVAQFKAFVDAKKAVDANFTKGDDYTLRAPGNHPVQSVNWHEARDYCKWLQEQLLNEKSLKNNEIVKLIQKDWEIDLPSELEWERAARGGERNRVFPWGDDDDDEADANRANYDDTKIGGTSTVGCFALNHGLYDMSGNVWEWTRSLWGTDWQKPDFGYPYELSTMAERENFEAGDDVMRVVRGGSWLSHAVDARCVYRCGFNSGLSPQPHRDSCGVAFAP